MRSNVGSVPLAAPVESTSRGRPTIRNISVPTIAATRTRCKHKPKIGGCRQKQRQVTHLADLMVGHLTPKAHRLLKRGYIRSVAGDDRCRQLPPPLGMIA
jgi:hypothetical protein